MEERINPFSILPSIEYDPPDKTDAGPGPQVFEIGLTLAGAISAGAYIAGVLDFLFEALDAWEAAKAAESNSGKTVPNHTVRLSVISGASGGGMNAAIAASAIAREFPYVRRGETEDKNRTADNPFFSTWVDKIDVGKLLDTSDLDKEPGKPTELRSILNSAPLQRIADEVIGAHGTEKKRDWVASPLRIFLTTGNLRGVPYTARAAVGGHYMRVHRDHVRFAIMRPPDADAQRDESAPEGLGKTYDNEILLEAPAADAAAWRSLSVTALASGAFPIALQPRVIAARKVHYSLRHVNRDSDTLDLSAVEPGIQLDDHPYLAVDGGTMDNEPLELARITMAGAYGRNPRDGNKADRATILIDPFVQPPKEGPPSDRIPAEEEKEGQTGDDRPLHYILPHEIAGALLGAWKMQSRFNPRDLQLASSGSVYSRYLIAPSRKVGDHDPGNHLASAVLNGFGAFLSRDFRVHDFLLGRRNCQWFLARHFGLPAGNPLFKNWNDRDYASDYTYLNSKSEALLQIIPLVGDLRPPTDETTENNTLPKWPAGTVDIDPIIDLVKKRFDAVWTALIEVYKPSWVLRLTLKTCGRWKVRNIVADKVLEKVDKDLEKHGLK